MFLRTQADVKRNPDLVLLLHIFGVKQLYLDLQSEETRRELFQPIPSSAHSRQAT
jgi:hypothetical protein